MDTLLVITHMLTRARHPHTPLPVPGPSPDRLVNNLRRPRRPPSPSRFPRPSSPGGRPSYLWLPREGAHDQEWLLRGQIQGILVVRGGGGCREVGGGAGVAGGAGGVRVGVLCRGGEDGCVVFPEEKGLGPWGGGLSSLRLGPRSRLRLLVCSRCCLG